MLKFNEDLHLVETPAELTAKFKNLISHETTTPEYTFPLFIKFNYICLNNQLFLSNSSLYLKIKHD